LFLSYPRMSTPKRKFRYKQQVLQALNTALELPPHTTCTEQAVLKHELAMVAVEHEYERFEELTKEENRLKEKRQQLLREVVQYCQDVVQSYTKTPS